jgi:hypothetical protein
MTARPSTLTFMLIVAALALGAVGAEATGPTKAQKCPAPCQKFPATGQTTVFEADKNDGILGTVAVPDDGTVEAGATLSYTENPDGTITDNNTGLQWEKKSDDKGLHDKDNTYVWSRAAFADPADETIWDWLEDGNAENGTGFAGFNDWRVLNAKELHSIVDYEVFPGPLVSAAFNNSCDSGDTVTDGSCAAEFGSWSSTTSPADLGDALLVDFSTGEVVSDGKVEFHRVRAVRGGSP